MKYPLFQRNGSFYKLLLLTCILLTCLPYANQAQKNEETTPPNILLIVSEDNGPDLGCYGVEAVKSPHLDRLAEEGVLFENAFVTYSVCSPSRGTLFTGLYPHQNGQIGLATHKFRMHDDLKTLPVYLKEAGYRTGCLGKIHVNPETLVPFDFHPIKSSNFAKKKLPDYAKEAAKFINQSDSAFFLMVNFPDAHFPLQRQVEGMPANPIDGKDLQQSLPFVGADSERLREFTANYYNSMMRLDESVGMLLDSLNASGKRRETIIIYLGDHGAQFSRGKCSNYEAGLRVPFIVNWPGKIEGGRRNEALVSSIDLMPTILELADVEMPNELPGISLLPNLKNKEAKSDRQYIFAGGNGSTSLLYFPRRSIRDERYKLINNLLSDRENPKFRFYADHHNQHFAAGTTEAEIAAAPENIQEAYACWKSPPPFELYDLKNDPFEFNNLIDEQTHHAIFERLKMALENWQEATQDPFRKPEILAKFNAEIDEVNQKYPNHTYAKNPNFEWSYLDYFRENKVLQQTDLFVGGEDGIANYRIPALVTTTKGTLLAACDARVDRRGDLPNNIDLALRRSTDNGKTWSKPKIIIDYPGQEGGGDPAMLVDQETGLIWLFFVYGAEGIGINQSKQGFGKDTTQQLMLIHSTDDGLTWSEPRNITKEVKKEDWYGIFFASGRGLQLRSGRLMVNLMVKKEFGTSKQDHAYIAYSDDHGETWQTSASAGDKMGESKSVELDDGSVMINMRSKHKRHHRAINMSKDGGKTWGEYSHESGLIEPTCNASIIRYTSVKDGFEKSRLLFSNPADENKRQNMAVRISYDEGKTWSPPKVIHSGPAAYSSLTVLADGSIGLFYERGDLRADEKITFARFTLEWLTDGKDKLSKKY